MDFLKEIELLELTSNYADNIIKSYERGEGEYIVEDIGEFEKHSDSILSIVNCINILFSYENGIIYFD